MKIKLGVVMDPIGAIHFKKDSTLAMLLAAQARGWELYYMEQPDLFLQGGRCLARQGRLHVRDDENDWFSLAQPQTAPLDELDVVLMRKDPPVDMEFMYTTFLLERAEAHGTLIVNRPAGLAQCKRKTLYRLVRELLPADAGQPGHRAAEGIPRRIS